MKKSVAVILVLAVLALVLLFSKGNLTGWQMLDLPAPPSPPGMGGDEEEEEAIIETVDYEDIPPEPEPPGYYEEEVVEEPVVTIETYAPVDASVSSRLDAIERTLDSTITPAIRALQENLAEFYTMKSDVDALKVETRNLRQQPSVEFPLSVTDIEGPIKRNLVLTVSFFVFVMLIIVVMISVVIINRHNDAVDNKRLLRQYLVNYQNAGYKLETLRMHLRACGWKDELIEEIVRKLPK